MIIPVRCFTCGKVLADKWLMYKKEVEMLENVKESTEDDLQLAENFDKKMKGKVLDKLHINRICCRRHMLTHIDLIDII
jgi:DNA-directed RNA polymerase subunit N (RpoN/RPB10)